MAPDAANIHATVVVLGDRGVAITGPSGSGKTTLALSLISRYTAAGRFARLVADDQAFVVARSGRLIASAPQAIAGRVEARGLGPVPANHEPGAVVDVVIELVERNNAPRLATGEKRVLMHVELPLFRLPALDTAGSTLAVDAIVASLLRPNDQLPANR